MYDPTSPLIRPVVSADGTPNPEAKVRFAEDRLLDAVIWCELPPSEVVTEADVMARFGLTKAAARSGLARLGYDGWASPQPRTGWQILPLSGGLIGQIIEARRTVEPILAELLLSSDAIAELEQIANVLSAMQGRSEIGVIRSIDHYLGRVDGLMLECCNPFTARHLRKLWHHSARAIHYFNSAHPDQSFRRTDALDLVSALCARDKEKILAARTALIDAHELFFQRQMLRDETPLIAHMSTQNRSTKIENGRKQ